MFTVNGVEQKNVFMAISAIADIIMKKDPEIAPARARAIARERLLIASNRGSWDTYCGGFIITYICSCNK